MTKTVTVAIIATSSEWSNSGITVTEMDATSIQCTSSHLTSFAVLVAPAGEVSY